jgi:hypothetical protein
VCDNYASAANIANTDTVTAVGSGTVDCVITLGASGTWTGPADISATTTVLLVGGGGGGGENVGYGGGGGASIYGTFSFTSGNSLNVTVGAGGAAGVWPGNSTTASIYSNGQNGTASIISASGINVSAGGGTGGHTAWTNNVCGGAGYQTDANTPGGTVGSTTGLTNVTSSAGGTGGRDNNTAAGSNGATQSTQFSITGTATWYGGGGGASGWGNYSGGTGASGGGGNGSSTNGYILGGDPYSYGSQGAPGNFYGGGGGGGNAGCEQGGVGYQGVVILRYTPTPKISISTNPNNQSISAGNTTTLNCLATGIGTTSYQWYSSTDTGTTWNAISGATSASYTTPALPYTSNGIQYRSIMTNTYNGLTVQATSSSATVAISQNSSTATVSLAGTPTNLQYNKTNTLTATLSAGDAYVTFYINNRKIFRCTSVLSTSSVATCQFRPNVHGFVKLSVTTVPTSSNYLATSAYQMIQIVSRNQSRG